MADRSIEPILISDDSDDEPLRRLIRPKVSMSSRILANAGGSGGSAPRVPEPRKKKIGRVDSAGVDDDEMDVDAKERVLDMIKASEQRGIEMGPVGDDLGANGTGEKEDEGHNSSETSDSDSDHAESDLEDIVTP